MSPPHMHRQNAEEQAIITCSNHFISGFSSTDPYFPIRKCDRLLSQCMITLNLLRISRVNLDLSVYAYLFGPYYFNKSLMEPPGNSMIVHDRPGNHTSWIHHSTKVWYIGPSLEHYRCMQFYMPSTGIV